MTLQVKLRPHLERGGYHTDRFDAVLCTTGGGEDVVHVGRGGWYPVARALLELGYPPTEELHIQHEGAPDDPTIRPRTLGDLAEWAVVESERDGLMLRKWQPFGGG